MNVQIAKPDIGILRRKMPIKGAKEFKKFEEGKPLTRKEALFAQCFSCNGFEAEDCLANHCPLYQWSPYRKKSILGIPKLKKTMTTEQLKSLSEGRLRARQAKA